VNAVDPGVVNRRSAVDTVAGLMSAAALFFSLIALAYHPLPVSIAAILLALIGAGMSSRHRTLATTAVTVSALCFVGGLVIAVVTKHSLW
jgi:uncharacterized membrane protein YozB (DUF420 family)